MKTKKYFYDLKKLNLKDIKTVVFVLKKTGVKKYLNKFCRYLKEAIPK